MKKKGVYFWWFVPRVSVKEKYEGETTPSFLRPLKFGRKEGRKKLRASAFFRPDTKRKVRMKQGTGLDFFFCPDLTQHETRSDLRGLAAEANSVNRRRAGANQKKEVRRWGT